jgi:glucosamine 6-phosphate synthetase-like amidotransferase/phosphosugar isomerase protein
VYVNDQECYVRKNGENHDPKTESGWPWNNDNKYDVYLGHVQAPTSSSRQVIAETTHPFESGDWLVAHNGVLENFEELKQSYYISDHTNPVDSSIIPVLLSELWVGDELLCIKETCEKLKGTFACWIVNKVSKNVFFVRSGSTLYMNDIRGEISSVKYTDLEQEMLQGKIYQLTGEGITIVGEFKADSPFFI